MAKRAGSGRDGGERQSVGERSDREQVAESVSASPDDPVGVERGDADAARDLVDGDASSPAGSEDAAQDEGVPPAPTRAPNTGDGTSGEIVDRSDVAEGRLPESADPLRASTWDQVRDVQREGMFDLGLEGYDQPRGAAADTPADYGGRPTYSSFTERAMDLAEKAAAGDEDAARQLDALRDQARQYREERTGTGGTGGEAEVADRGPSQDDGSSTADDGDGTGTRDPKIDVSKGTGYRQMYDAMHEEDRIQGAEPFDPGKATMAEQRVDQRIGDGLSWGGKESNQPKEPKDPGPDGAEGTTPEGDPLYDALKAMQEDQLAGAYPGRTRGGDIDPAGGEGGEDTTSGQVSTDEELKDPEQDRSPGGAARVEERPTGTVDHLIRGAEDTGPHAGETEDVPEVGTVPPSPSLSDQDVLARFRDNPSELEFEVDGGRSRLSDAADDDASSDDPLAGFDPDPTAGVPADEPEPVEDPDADAAGADRAVGDVRLLGEADDDAAPMRGGEDLFDLG